MTDVTVIGLGAMGTALAVALLKASQRVTVWNRTAARAAPLVQRGATAANDVRQAVAASPVIVVCVYDYKASRAVLEEAGDALAGKVLIEFSTGSPLDAREADRWAQNHGADYLDGALLATPSQIGRPDTPIFLSGSETAYRQAETALKAIGGGLMYRGGEPGAAAAWDIAALSSMFGMMFGFFHGVRVCEAEGLSVSAFGDMMGQISQVIGEMVRQQGKSIAADNFANPESSMAICAGSGTLFLRQAREAGISAEFPTFADGLFRRAMAAGLGEETLSSMVKVLRG
ncbi:MAG: NAD(P)-dependent oxidoreductase [Reyranella sp.]|jgi:3-hydroxyisobutyrate dehydrogenase-like beta-hydroxyacid dehydrogenase|uniref:NAD(P)-dependent oxidoreductase n=1 Tax=Reyranella sp. TaxID=1929291 RepID=UPI0025F8B19F|nr:NAD(P)-binding domain-containing protein [Reyranella sp.]MBR2813299.1 NAD(P)-dependent oxidoreductase [Reyranella sp.]